LKDKVKVYPNPVSNIIHISYGTDEIATMQLYTINGLLLKESQSRDLNVSDISTGTYILKVKLNDAFSSYPVMIIR